MTCLVERAAPVMSMLLIMLVCYMPLGMLSNNGRGRDAVDATRETGALRGDDS